MSEPWFISIHPFSAETFEYNTPVNIHCVGFSDFSFFRYERSRALEQRKFSRSRKGTMWMRAFWINNQVRQWAVLMRLPRHREVMSRYVGNDRMQCIQKAWNLPTLSRTWQTKKKLMTEIRVTPAWSSSFRRDSRLFTAFGFFFA